MLVAEKKKINSSEFHFSTTGGDSDRKTPWHHWIMHVFPTLDAGLWGEVRWRAGIIECASSGGPTACHFFLTQQIYTGTFVGAECLNSALRDCSKSYAPLAKRMNLWYVPICARMCMCVFAKKKKKAKRWSKWAAQIKNLNPVTKWN